MHKLYLILDVLTILFPLLLSFDQKVAYYRTWKAVFVAILVVGIPFLAWDMVFTHWNVWGFNPTYLTGINLGNLPVEEVLFFVVVPFSCTFIYACTKVYLRRLKLKGFNQVFYALLVIYALIVLVFGKGGWYATVVSILTLISVMVIQRLKRDLRFLPIAFCLALIPFFIVNGILTGTGLEEPIVWYSEAEIVGKRMLTIPIEDVLYGWVLIAGNIGVYSFMTKDRK